MRVFVTGAGGFLGRALCRRLQAEGASVTRLEHDLRQRELVCKAVRDSQAEVVYHLAACIKRTPDALTELQEVNVQGTLGLLNACLETRPFVVAAGTSDEYGNGQAPFEEHHPLKPLTPYAASKATASLWLPTYTELGLPLCVARLFLLYGPGQGPGFFLPQLLEAQRTGVPLRMTGGEQTRDFVWVEDAVEALLRLGRNRPAGRAFNICTGTDHSLREVVRALERVTGRPVPVELGAIPYRPGEIFRIAGSPARLEEAVGYRPSTSLEEGLRQIV